LLQQTSTFNIRGYKNKKPGQNGPGFKFCFKKLFSF
jgi:hypothetical protein